LFTKKKFQNGKKLNHHLLMNKLTLNGLKLPQKHHPQLLKKYQYLKNSSH